MKIMHPKAGKREGKVWRFKCGEGEIFIHEDDLRTFNRKMMTKPSRFERFVLWLFGPGRDA